MDLAISSTVTFAAACALQPLYGFTLLCWSQPTSFVANFARRRIRAITDIFERRFASEDTHNVPEFHYFKLSSRAWLANAALRAAIVWCATRRYSRITSWVSNFIASRRVVKDKRQQQEAEEEKQAKKETDSNADDDDHEKNKRDSIVDFLAGTSSATLLALVLTPASAILTIFTADVSGGYARMTNVWNGVRSSAINDYDRENPIYQPGRNPWNKTQKRPRMAKLLLNRLGRLDGYVRIVAPWLLTAAVNAAVFHISQSFFRRRGGGGGVEEEGAAKEDVEGRTKKSDRRMRTLLRAAKVFGTAAVLHGTFAYFMSPVLARAARTVVRMPEYTQPYNVMGAGEFGTPASAPDLFLTDPSKLEVPRVDVVYGMLEATLWGSIAALQAVL